MNLTRKGRRIFQLAMMAVAIQLCAAVVPTHAGDVNPASERDVSAVADCQGGVLVLIGHIPPIVLDRALDRDDVLVQCLARDQDQLEDIRNRIKRKDAYGKLSADLWEGGPALPLIDNFVNWLFFDTSVRIPDAEVLRVLAPRGIAFAAGRWIVKPVPDDTDEWTHYLYDPSNNPVSKDRRIGKLGRLQWVGSPRWSRHHDHMSSVTTAVTAGGRVYVITDEGSRSSIYLPPKWKLVARDAYNGMILWKRDVPEWFRHTHGLKSGPPYLTRKLVAKDNAVYVTIELDGMLSKLDGRNGKTLRTYKNTNRTQEVLLKDGVLYLVTKASDEPDNLKRKGNPKEIVAIDEETGEVLWKRSASWVAPCSLATDGKGIFYFDGQNVTALSTSSGEQIWQSPLPYIQTDFAFFAPSIAVSDGVVLFAGGEEFKPHWGSDGVMTALDAESGKKLWEAKHAPSGYQSPEDIFVANGVVWCGDVNHHGIPGTPNRGVTPSTGTFRGVDLKTGKLVKTILQPKEPWNWFHHRCYPGKATEDYLLMSRTGIEMIDLESSKWTMHHWVRGACLFGIMPANGLIYAPQHPCACYTMAKMDGFSVLAAEKPGTKNAAISAGPRLEKGPSYAALQSTIGNQKSKIPNAWPCYRHDPERSGRYPNDLPGELSVAWEKKIASRTSLQPIVADGKLFVVVKDEHAIHALDAKSGETLWTFTAGGRVDSPPTFSDGALVFGCCDGKIYCLDASSGQPAWTFRAPAVNRKHMHFEQIESTHPVHGSVLVLDGKVYAVSGRSRFVDEGIRLLVLDLRTGDIVEETRLGNLDAEGEKDFQRFHQGLGMPTARTDILVKEGDTLYMRTQKFSLDGQADNKDLSFKVDDALRDRHLLAPTSFMDDSFWHRSYWVYGNGFNSGHGGYHVAGRHFPAGRVLVFDRETVYGYGRLASQYRWSTPLEFALFAADKNAKVVTDSPKDDTKKQPARRRGGQKFERQWEEPCDIQVFAMLLAKNRLYVLGVRDVLDELNRGNLFKDNTEQDEHMLGKHGSVLAIVDPATGEVAKRYEFDFFPSFDGMSAAEGKIYIACQDGTVVCLEADVAAQ